MSQQINPKPENADGPAAQIIHLDYQQQSESSALRSHVEPIESDAPPHVRAVIILLISATILAVLFLIGFLFFRARPDWNPWE